MAMNYIYKSPLLPQTVEERDGDRYALEARVDFVQDGAPVGLGELIDISRSGAAVRAHTPLKVVGQYLVLIGGIGNFSGTIIRQFNINCYGVRFDISSGAKIQLDRRLNKLAEAESTLLRRPIIRPFDTGIPPNERGGAMEQSGFSEEQIIGILKEYDAGLTVADLCQTHGMSSNSFYSWKEKFGGVDMSEAMKLNSLELENARLKILLANAMVDNAALKDLVSKSGDGGTYANWWSGSNDDPLPFQTTEQ